MTSGVSEKYYFVDGTAGIILDTLIVPNRMLATMCENTQGPNMGTMEKIFKITRFFLFRYVVVFPTLGLAKLIDKIARTKIDPTVYEVQESQWSKYLITFKDDEHKQVIIRDLISAKINPPSDRRLVMWLNCTFNGPSHSVMGVEQKIKDSHKFLVIGTPTFYNDLCPTRDFKDLLYEGPFTSIPETKDKCDTVWLSCNGLFRSSERKLLRDRLNLLNS